MFIAAKVDHFVLEIMSYSFHHCCQHIDLWAPARQCTSTLSPLFILKNFRWMLSKTLNGGWKIIKIWNKSPVLIPLSRSSAIWLFRYAIKNTLKKKYQSRKVLKQVLLTGLASTLYIYFFAKSYFKPVLEKVHEGKEKINYCLILWPSLSLDKYFKIWR